MYKVIGLLVLLSALVHSNEALSFTPPPTTIPPPPTTIPTTPYPTTMPPGYFPPTPKPYYKSSYAIIAPATIRPAMRYRVGVNIVKTKVWCRIHAMIKKGSTIVAQASGNFRKGSEGRLVLKIPKDLEVGSYILVVTSKGGLHFSHHHSLRFKSKKMSMFIQTDKGIYKPGDKVRFRALGLFPNLHVYRGNMDVSISDPQNNKIKQWLNQSASNGVFVKDLQLSSLPNLGDWTIEVKTEREGVKKQFKVARYVLPKFEVSVLMPSYSVISDKAIAFTVKAKYTFGKPLKGMLDISFKIVHSSQNYDFPYIKVFKQISVPISGDAQVSITMDEIKAVRKYLNGYKLAVFAVVTDSETGNSQSSTGDVQIYSKGFKMEFPTINPKTFKPGLKYMAYLKVSQPDDLPINLSEKKITISTRFTIETPQKPEYHHGQWYKTPPVKRTKYLPNFELAVPENGLVVFHVPSEAGASSVYISARYDGLYASLSLKKSYSPSNSYIQAMLMTKMMISAGDDIEFSLRSTQPMGVLQYQILARGEIIYTGSFAGNNKKQMTVSLRAISQMAPTARIVVYFIRSDGEIVTDSISFDVSGAFRNKVDLSLSEDVVHPGDDIRVTVKADPGSHAYLLALDQSLLLLAAGNDITTNDVYDELDHFDYYSSGQVTPRPLPIFFGGGIEGGMVRRGIRLPYPVYIGGSDAKKIFENAGVIVLTDALVYKYKPPNYYHPYGATYAAATAIPKMMESQAHHATSIPAPGGGLKEADMRTNFAETWLWTEVRTCVNGEATVITSVPDTITSWIASGFAVNDYSGFGMPNAPSHLRVFKPFFISLNLPYSIVLGEQVAIQVVIFNYMDSDQLVKITLESLVSFTSIYVDCNGVEYRLQKDQFFSIMVKAGATQSVFFPIIALSLGYIDIQIRAQSLKAADGVKRKLLVEAPGIPLDYNIPVLIDLTGKIAAFQKTILISLPPNTVTGSELLKISAIGDLMGPSITGLDKLLIIPMGCGEQTMLSLAPDVYITQYLKLTNQLSGKIKDKALLYMEKGYQNELKYRHPDGSFSAFISDKSGSMWLTAFVARVFHQAQNYIFLDISVIRKAVQWMVLRQKPDGSFPEPGRVIHKNMQGQAGSGVSLSAFVFISLLENKDIFKDTPYWQTKLDTAKAKCLSYLEDQVSESDDLYLMSLAVYAFQLAESNQTDALLDRLNQRAITADGLVHWHQKESKKPKVGIWHRPNPSSAVDVEITSYVLMVYAIRQDIGAGRKIMQWVTAQRNSHGGFSSTQDTVVALNALSMFAELIYSDSFDIEAKVVLDQGEMFKFKINHQNALISQRRETKDMPREINVYAKGRGMALVELSVFFNIEVEIEDVIFDLSITISNHTKNHFILETCTSWLGDGEASGMAVQEIGIPSGFEADTEPLKKMAIIRKTETENKKVILYFDEISKKPLCVSIRIDRTGLVARVKAAAVKVFDYYEPSNKIREFYQPGFLMNSNICDICELCHNCNVQPEGIPPGSAKTPMDEENAIEMAMKGTI